MYQEPKEQNDLFFTCSLLEYIARKTKNKKKDIIVMMGEGVISKIYRHAEVYHSENIDQVADEFIALCNIPIGNYDTVVMCKDRVPSHFEIGRVYQRLILMVDNREENYIKTMMQVLSSKIIETMDNYNCSMFYENPDYIYQCYLEGKIL